MIYIVTDEYGELICTLKIDNEQCKMWQVIPCGIEGCEECRKEMRVLDSD